MLLNFVDVWSDIKLGVPLWHIIEESAIVAISGALVIYLIIDMRKRTLALVSLSKQLTQSHKKLSDISEEMKVVRRQFSEMIKQQFNQWQLSSSEQEVAILLLKGLSLKEIAVLRDTKEKTVRHQASSVYAKSNLDGRHEFSAWFLEDFIALKQQESGSLS